jgi:cytochrome bd-type quinol oxidase subunit 2
MNENTSLDAARNQLAKIWFWGSSLPFMILTIQSILGKYGENVQDAFSWFIPTVFPTLTLMISVIGAAALKPKEDRVIRTNFLKITVGISIAYLIVLSLVIFLQPFSRYEDPIKLFSISNFFIAPLQGIAVGSLGFLFTSDTPKKE